ncbi:hypothetical protein Tco_0467454 [Tanacetum coccineum]
MGKVAVGATGMAVGGVSLSHHGVERGRGASSPPILPTILVPEVVGIVLVSQGAVECVRPGCANSMCPCRWYAYGGDLVLWLGEILLDGDTTTFETWLVFLWGGSPQIKIHRIPVGEGRSFKREGGAAFLLRTGFYFEALLAL